jgi:hypothetical protein
MAAASRRCRKALKPCGASLAHRAGRLNSRDRNPTLIGNRGLGLAAQPGQEAPNNVAAHEPRLDQDREQEDEPKEGGHRSRRQLGDA